LLQPLLLLYHKERLASFDCADALITVGIIKNGTITIEVSGENATLLSNKENEELADEIVFVMKTFTTSLLCKAIAEGEVQLKDSIVKYLELPPKDYYPI